MEKIKNCGKHEKRSRLADLPAVGRAMGDFFKPPAGLRTNLTIGQAAPAQPVNRTFARKSTRGVSRAAQVDSGRKSPELSLAKAAAFLEGKSKRRNGNKFSVP